MNRKELSPMKQLALAVVNSATRKIKYQILNDCSDEEITQNIARVHPDLRGTYKEEDYLSYDKALKVLGFGYNRNKLNELAKKHNVKNHTFNNAHIGFKKDDIEMLKRILANKE